MSNQLIVSGSYYFTFDGYSYLSFCAMLVFGSFPGGTIVNGAVVAPGLTPASVRAIAASSPNIAYNAPAVASTTASVSPNLCGPTQARPRVHMHTRQEECTLHGARATCASPQLVNFSSLMSAPPYTTCISNVAPWWSVAGGSDPMPFFQARARAGSALLCGTSSAPLCCTATRAKRRWTCSTCPPSLRCSSSCGRTCPAVKPWRPSSWLSPTRRWRRAPPPRCRRTPQHRASP